MYTRKTKMLLAVLACLTGIFLFCLPALAKEYPESSHPYENDLDKTWVYTHPEDVDYLLVTFSNSTAFESGKDKLYVTDMHGETMTFTGTTLAGGILSLPGSTFTLRLTSDSSVALYGFSISSIVGVDTGSDYSIDENGLITAYYGTAAEVVTPDFVDGIRVTGIGANAFANSTTLEKVTLTGYVTTIGDNAF